MGLIDRFGDAARKALDEGQRAYSESDAGQPRAPDANPEQRWEYKVVQVGGFRQASLRNAIFEAGEIEGMFNDLGSKGWELVDITHEDKGAVATFKRRRMT